jgi:thiol-disulfide isomerase/thioredoxin
VTKRVLAVGLLGLAIGMGRADARKSDAEKKASAERKGPDVSLKVGDPVPPLVASAWLQGNAVDKFERGKVYVVEFWATWCGICIAFMPETSELQVQYRDKGVTMIAYTAADPDNSKEKVIEFVKRRGPRFHYAFAYAADRATYDAWMTASGRAGLPEVFVVDRAGRLAYIGHPMYLGIAVAKIVAPDSDAVTVGKEMEKVEHEFQAIFRARERNPEAMCRALAAFQAKYPAMVDNAVVVRSKLSLLPEAGRISEAKEVAETGITRAIAREDFNSAAQVSALLRNGPGKKSPELLAVALKAAEVEVRIAGEGNARARIDLAECCLAVGDRARARECCGKAARIAGDKDAAILLSLARTYSALGDEAEAKNYASRAVAAAAGGPAPLRQQIEREARQIGEPGQKRD